MPDSDNQLFVYGSLMSDFRSFSLLESLASGGYEATTKGILLFHRGTDKNFPFLFTDKGSLDKISSHMGIKPHSIKGEVFEVRDTNAYQILDSAEGIGPLSRGIANANMLTRRELLVRTARGESIAQAYLANPQQGSVARMLKKSKLATKIVVPNGDWRKYIKEVHTTSLSYPDERTTTFGMETEFSLMAVDNLKNIPIQMYKGRQLTVKDQAGKTFEYGSLCKLLSHALHEHFQAKSSRKKSSFMYQYVEYEPYINNRFLMPFGVTYVDGEDVQDGEILHPIRMLPISKIGKVDNKTWLRDNRTLDEIACTEKEDSNNVPLEHQFFEVAGFPSKIEPGFAVDAVAEELVRRYHLAAALQDVKAVKAKQGFKDISGLLGNSSQYNATLDSTLLFADLSKTKVAVSQQQAIDKDMSKYTRDVAWVLGNTFGPLLSYLLSGKPGHVEYKVRGSPNHFRKEGEEANRIYKFSDPALHLPDRIEYRNTVIHNPEQMVAGISVFAAAVKTVEDKIKQKILKKASLEHMKEASKLTPEQILEAFSNIEPENYLSEFRAHVKPVDYSSSKFRHGFLVDENQSYHRAVHNGSEFAMMVNGQEGQYNIADAINMIFSDNMFLTNLRDMTTIQEYSVITRFIEGDLQVESKNPCMHCVGATYFSKLFESIGGGEIESYKGRKTSFSGMLTQLLFGYNAVMEFMDDDHKIVVEPSKSNELENHQQVGGYNKVSGTRMDPIETYDQSRLPRESDIYMGSIPLTISLVHDGVTVDSFNKRMTPSNVGKFHNLLGRNLKIAPDRAWEAYYWLK